MKFRKILCYVLIFAMTMSLGAPAFADSIVADAYLSGRKALNINPDNTISIENSSVIEGHLINDDYTVSSTTIDDVEKIVNERGLALLRGDKEKVSELENELDRIGVRNSTPDEIQSFSAISAKSGKAANSNVTYKTSTYSVTVNNKTYQVKETIALPTTNSNLFHSVSVNKKNVSSSVASGDYELLKVIGTAALGSAYAQYQRYISAFEALASVIPGFSSTTNVYGITATYACAALEQVRFYQYKSSSGYWNPFGSSSYVQTAFSATVFSTSYAGGSKQGLNMAVKAIEDTVYSSYSYGAANILKRYFETYIFDKKSQVVNVIFYHNADGTRKTITSIGMLCPSTTADIK